MDANVNFVNSNGETPLTWAVEIGNEFIVRRLLSKVKEQEFIARVRLSKVKEQEFIVRGRFTKMVEQKVNM